MQKVLLIGNLGRDPEVKYSQQGTAIAQFSVATTERWKDKDGEPQEHTEWFAVKAFNRLAEIAGEHLHKGSRIYVEGRKRTESWDDKQTGAKHYRDLVYVDRIEFLDSRAAETAIGTRRKRLRRDNSDRPGRAVLTNDIDSSSLYFDACAKHWCHQVTFEANRIVCEPVE